MQTKKNTLPPLDYLLSFEVAARFESFALASRELEISESAISRKIRLLEEHYETPLFRRGNKSVSLTRKGAMLLEKIRPALEDLRESSAEVLAQKHVLDINLAATASVVSLWLLPRLRNFSRTNAQTNITLISSDDDAECLAENIDLSILRGDGNWPNYTSRKLFGEVIFPVCSPAFLASNPNATNLTSLAGLPLIEVSNKHPEWMNWDEWLRGHLPAAPTPSKSSVFNVYPNAIQAAVDGMGIALGWGHLIDHLLESGALVRPLGDTHTRTEFGYYLLQRKKITAHPKQKIVEEWLLSESAARDTHSVRK